MRKGVSMQMRIRNSNVSHFFLISAEQKIADTYYLSVFPYKEQNDEIGMELLILTGFHHLFTSS